MTWTYEVKTGALEHEGEFVGTGYSGVPECRNDPTKEGLKDRGPIPRGRYLMGMASNDRRLGPCVIPLLPMVGTDTMNRSGFFMHGGSRSHPEASSHGCIVIGPLIRRAVAIDGDRVLDVI